MCVEQQQHQQQQQQQQQYKWMANEELSPEAESRLSFSYPVILEGKCLGDNQSWDKSGNRNWNRRAIFWWADIYREGGEREEEVTWCTWKTVADERADERADDPAGWSWLSRPVTAVNPTPVWLRLGIKMRNADWMEYVITIRQIIEADYPSTRHRSINPIQTVMI